MARFRGKGGRQVSEKKLSGLNGVKDVTFGHAPPARREGRDFSKQGIPSATDSLANMDDHKERRKRFESFL